MIEKDETLWCTPHGQVAALRSKPIRDFIRGEGEGRWRRSERQSRRRGARPDGRTDAQTSGAQRCAGVPHPAAAARPQVSDPARAAVHGGDRSGRARAGLPADQGAAALAAAARDEAGDPLCVASVSGRRTAQRTARSRADRGRSRRGLHTLRRARHRRVDAPDDEPERPATSTAPTTSIRRTGSCSTIPTSASGPSTCSGSSTGSRPGHARCTWPPKGGRRAGDVRGAALASGDAA